MRHFPTLLPVLLLLLLPLKTQAQGSFAATPGYSNLSPDTQTTQPPPGQYVLTNVSTGQSMYVELTSTGQLFLLNTQAPQNSFPQQPVSNPLPANQIQTYQPTPQVMSQPLPAQILPQQYQQEQFQEPCSAQQTSTSQNQSQSQSQPQSSKMNIVGNALKGALGMYMNYKYGISAATGYPASYGIAYPSMYSSYTQNTGIGGILHSLF